MLLLGQSYAEVEPFSRKNMKRLSLFYLQGLPEGQAVKAEPDYKDNLPSKTLFFAGAAMFQRKGPGDPQSQRLCGS
jgi:hypothetical protein